MVNVGWSLVWRFFVCSLLFGEVCRANSKREELVAQVDQAIRNEEYQKAARLVESITAVPLFRTIKVPKWWAPLYFKKGWCELKLKEWKKAANSFEVCHKVDRDLGSNPYSLEALRGWARAEASLKNQDTAIKLLKRYVRETSAFDWEDPLKLGRAEDPEKPK